MADPTLRDVTWGGLHRNVAADLVREVLAAGTLSVEVTPSHERTIGGREVDVEVRHATLAQVRHLAEMVDVLVAGPAEETPGG